MGLVTYMFIRSKRSSSVPQSDAITEATQRGFAIQKQQALDEQNRLREIDSINRRIAELNYTRGHTDAGCAVCNERPNGQDCATCRSYHASRGEVSQLINRREELST